jgi:DNA-binding transcriptional LysR family regulator
MHLKFVEIFCDVALRRSFSKGAAANDISQSAASQAVLAIERRLGTTLIDRSKRPLELTPAGQVYLDGCRDVLQDYRALEDQVRQLDDRVAGTVRVAAIYSVGLMQMESYTRRFAELYPDTQVHLEYLHPDQVYAQVLGDEADIGLVSFPRPNGELVSVDWQKQPMVLVVPPGHKLAHRNGHRVRAEELSGLGYVGFTHDLAIRREVDRWFKRARVVVNVKREFDNIENIKRAIEAGSGVAVLPEPTAKQEVAAGSLVAVKFSDVSWFRPLGIIHKRNKQLTQVVRKLIELLHADPAAFPKPNGASAGAAFVRPAVRNRNGAAVRRRAAATGSKASKRA